MAHRPTNLLSDEETRFHVEELQGGKMDTVIELSAAPTAAIPLIRSGEWGFYSNVLYHRVGSKICVFNVLGIINVT